MTYLGEQCTVDKNIRNVAFAVAAAMMVSRTSPGLLVQASGSYVHSQSQSVERQSDSNHP